MSVLGKIALAAIKTALSIVIMHTVMIEQRKAPNKRIVFAMLSFLACFVTTPSIWPTLPSSI